MQKNILKILFLIIITGTFLAPGFVSAGVLGDINKNLGDFQGVLGLPEGKTDLAGLVVNIINFLLGLLGLFFVILIIYAGFTWMTAQGDKDKVEKAKNTIKNSVYGVAIILLAYVVAHYVVKIVIDIIQTGGEGVEL